MDAAEQDTGVGAEVLSKRPAVGSQSSISGTEMEGDRERK